MNMKNNKWLIVGGILVVLLLLFLALGGGNSLSLMGTALATCDETPLAQNQFLGMIQAPWGVNVRIGAGQNYDYVNAAKMGLPKCTIFELLGRNPDATWLLVKSETENLMGWIAIGQTWDGTPWEKINMNIMDLPVSKAVFGSQQTSGGQSGTNKGIVVSINNNVASVSISGLAVNEPFYLMLAPSGNAVKSIAFYYGQADSNGNAQFKTTMPLTWADGSKVESGTLEMSAFSSVTGSLVGYLSFPYYR